MHAVIPVLPADLPQVEALLTRIADLGGVSQFPCVLVSTPEANLAKCHQLASGAFQSASVYLIEHIPEGYPKPRNILFSRTSFHLGNAIGDSFLYLDKDAWPLHSAWLKDLTNVYREHGYRFMGKLALTPDGTGEKYLMPTAIYPRDFFETSNLARQIKSTEDFALYLKDEIVHLGRAHDSGLFTLDESDRTAALMLGRQVFADTLSVDDPAIQKIKTESDVQYATGNALDSLAETTALPSKISDQIAIQLNAAGQRMADDFTRLVSEKKATGEVVTEGGKFKHNLGESPVNANLPVVREPNNSDAFTSYAQSESQAARPARSAHDLLASLDKLPETIPAETWTKSPEVFTGEPIPAAMNQPGTLPTYPSPVPAAVVTGVVTGIGVDPAHGDSETFTGALPAQGFATTEERNTAIKAAKAGGMPWKTLIATFKVGPVELKKVLNSI